MLSLFTDSHPAVLAAVLFVVGCCTGNLLLRWIVRMTPSESTGDAGEAPGCPNSPGWHRIPVFGSLLAGKRNSYRGERIGRWWAMTELGTGVLFACFAVALLKYDCQATPMVQPSEFWRVGRLFYHLILISLLIAATGTDIRDYFILDSVTMSGMFIGLVGAFAAAELQMMHIWLDWNQEVASYQHPFFPAWIDSHRHLHGLAWSAAGMITGAGLTWLMRTAGKLVLGYEAMGLGDVTLMAMIGSFTGWQPVIFVIMFGSVCGLVGGILLPLFSTRRYIPFGPYLSAGAVIVLFSWRDIWMLELPFLSGRGFSIRRFFGDWPSLLIMAGLATGLFLFMLMVLRGYRAIPTTAHRRIARDQASDRQTGNVDEEPNSGSS